MKDRPVNVLRSSAFILSAFLIAGCGDAAQGWSETPSGADDPGAPPPPQVGGATDGSVASVEPGDDGGVEAGTTDGAEGASPPDAAPGLSDGGASAAPASTNPLSPVVSYEQINLTESCGSCGSHAGAVSLGYFWGDTSASAVQVIEQSVYSNYGLPCRPGPSALVSAYNLYLAKWQKSVPWKAVLFTSSSEVAGYIAKGSPVVANTKQWGGHYVAIYGLKANSKGTTMVYFSDGTSGTGLSDGSLSTGNLKEWTWSSFLAEAATGEYIGFVHQ
jgi:hypothetical protein